MPLPENIKFPSVSALIVNYKSVSHCERCIHSLLQQRGVHLEIIVVDNASGDGSVTRLQIAFPTQVKLIASDENLGFGRANNLAFKYAQGEYLLIINPDVQFVGDNNLAQMICGFNQQTNIGVLGPDIIEPRRNNRVLPKKTYPLQHKIKADFSDLTGQYAWILGACMLFPRHVYEAVGGFDEDFFLYGEDADICLRIRQAGFAVHWFPDVKVEHWAGASEANAAEYAMRMRKKRGMYQFCLKHYPYKKMQPILLNTLRRCRLNLAILNVRRKYKFANNLNEIDARIARNQAEIDVVLQILEENNCDYFL